MSRKQSKKELAFKSSDLNWSLDNDVFLIENQDMPLEDQAKHLKLTVEEVSDRRCRLGLLQRAKAVMRLNVNE
ncbi:MAG: hypothetical protein H7Z73_12725 [Candidatus Saccharibacteria bacterium]|nr:hypothetical protein [Moraxellaceae bacterium]